MSKEKMSLPRTVSYANKKDRENEELIANTLNDVEYGLDMTDEKTANDFVANENVKVQSPFPQNKRFANCERMPISMRVRLRPYALVQMLHVYMLFTGHLHGNCRYSPKTVKEPSSGEHMAYHQPDSPCCHFSLMY
jgi:hypothetical protein